MLVLMMCVLFLCAAGEAPRGICVDTKCYAFFPESANSAEAMRRCQETGGTLYDVGLRDRPVLLLPLPHGHFWIRAGQKAGGRCWSVVVSSENPQLQNRTCTDRLDGILCQYTSTCRALPPSEGAYVNYTTPWGCEGKTVFPPGTVAVERVPEHPPISKHICAGRQWMRAPWSCEVMNGGCEHNCTQSHMCTCPQGQLLQHNSFTCADDPCAKCTHFCVKVEGKVECRCREGFKLESGGRCVDVDECSKDRTLCSGIGEACENTEGSYKCTCQEDYSPMGDLCVDSSFCSTCQHGCDEVQGEVVCICDKGFRVDPRDPTKCEEYCSEQDCPARCPGPNQCYCPSGFIPDQRDHGVMCTDIDECESEGQFCEHHCNNTWGGFFCDCDEGFQLQDEYHCVPLEPQLVVGQSRPTAATVHPTAIPSYVKMGSILGITVFALVCAALLYFLFHRLFTYCTKVQFYSLKRDMDIFTLQQVSTETYKRLSHDWQFRNDCHRL